ncbi:MULTISPECIES: hypothetical protein [Leeuwenhoekiella]|uniref:hypothetical protein n=1 Tax=Leeuwenhoekiella TaxID=283735 RepID=UPI000C3C188C|nr:hypothetical protein [Leeuwenhoekiella blandensis]MBQ52946.1 hypothetical protein [Leeuwenhoekiella sp.]|tara:strand:- start:654 stop:1025 length:372 start_codon:yes stop_codon:yes gene_type:complete
MAQVKHTNFLPIVLQTTPQFIKSDSALFPVVDYKFLEMHQKNHDVVCPNLSGRIDLKAFQTYRQLLYQTILRARKLYMNQIDFGLSANFEERKRVATVIPKQALVHTDDNFLLEYLEMMRTSN